MHRPPRRLLLVTLEIVGGAMTVAELLSQSRHTSGARHGVEQGYVMIELCATRAPGGDRASAAEIARPFFTACPARQGRMTRPLRLESSGLRSSNPLSSSSTPLLLP